MTCITCQSPMKPLFTGFFCPNDCDRKKTDEQSMGWWVTGKKDAELKYRLGMQTDLSPALNSKADVLRTGARYYAKEDHVIFRVNSKRVVVEYIEISYE